MAGRSHFCCCLPLRLGAGLITLFTAIFTLPSAGFMWYLLITHRYIGSSMDMKIAIGLLAAVDTINGLVALFGFIGTLTRRLSLIKPYVRLMGWQLAFSIVASFGFCVLFIKRSPAQWEEICQQLHLNPTDTANCASQRTGTIAGTITSIVISLLIQTYCYVIVSQYRKQLEQDVNSAVQMGPTGYAYQPAPAKMTDPYMVAPTVGYVYAEPQHSFGRA